MPRSSRGARAATAATAPAATAPAAGSPLLSSSVPQQTYSGQNIIELRLPPSWFIATAAGADQKEDQP